MVGASLNIKQTNKQTTKLTLIEKHFGTIFTEQSCMLMRLHEGTDPWLFAYDKRFSHDMAHVYYVRYSGHTTSLTEKK